MGSAVFRKTNAGLGDARAIQDCHGMTQQAEIHNLISEVNAKISQQTRMHAIIHEGKCSHLHECSA